MKKAIESEKVAELMMQPALNALENSQYKRDCPNYPDAQHLFVGIERVIQNNRSGRAWILHCRLTRGICVGVRNFFKALESKRRMRMVVDVLKNVRREVDSRVCGRGSDPLAEHSELDGFAVYASDGHSHAAASHEKPIEGKIRAINHIYTLNLRSHSMGHIALTEPALGKKKEHEICTLKRIGSEALRMGEKTGTKVLHAYDPAIIDYAQWHRWKHRFGIYVVTLEKSNSTLGKSSDTPFDADDPRNTGVVSDERICSSKGIQLRRIRYYDPEKGKLFSFITSEFTLPPGLIAFIYKLRWDIEKTFDQVKNLFGEKKAWATSPESKIQQAGFIALAHNLTLALEREIEKREGIRDEKVIKRKARRMKKQAQKSAAEGRVFSPLVSGVRRVTKRSAQYIGWLQACLEHKTCWREAMEQLRPLMEKYLW
jgi:uncharacterized small protein (DUF1192 family)